MSKRVSHVALLIILLVAFTLQLRAIERQDIWGDEAFSIWLSQQPFSEIVKGGADTHPPGYPLLLALWIRIAGSSPFATRALSVFAAFLVVSLVFVMGCRIYGPSTGLISALLCAASPMLVYYAQETRMYTLVTATTAASVYWTLRLMRGERSIRAWALYVLFTLVAIYTHYYAFFVVIAENLLLSMRWLRTRNWRRISRCFAVQAALGAAYVPWILAQTQFLSGKASARTSEWSLGTAGEIAGQTLTAFSAGIAVPAEQAQVIALTFGVVALLGALSSLNAERQKRWGPIFYLSVPGVIAWLVNPIMPFFFPRYLLLILPAFYLLVARGLHLLKNHRAIVMSVGLIALLIGSGRGLYGYYTDEQFIKGQYGQMMTYVEQHARPDDVLLLANPLQKRLFEYYRPEGIKAHYVGEATLSDVAKQHQRIWLVRFGNPAVYDPNGNLNRWFSTHGSKAHTSDWTDANLSLYVMQAAADDQPQHQVDVQLGESIWLEGYSLGADTLTPGDTLILTLFWTTTAPLNQRYTVFTHLMDPNGVLQAQMDSEPQGGSLPTDQWPVDQTITDNYAILLPKGIPAGDYQLNVGMYQLTTGERLPIYIAAGEARDQDYITLQTVEIQQP